jgi:hypothetical protein
MDYDLHSGSAYMQILCHMRDRMPIVSLHFLDKLCVCDLLHNAMLGKIFTLLLHIKDHLTLQEAHRTFVHITNQSSELTESKEVLQIVVCLVICSLPLGKMSDSVQLLFVCS